MGASRTWVQSIEGSNPKSAAWTLCRGHAEVSARCGVVLHGGDHWSPPSSIVWIEALGQHLGRPFCLMVPLAARLFWHRTDTARHREEGRIRTFYLLIKSPDPDPTQPTHATLTPQDFGLEPWNESVLVRPGSDTLVAGR